MAFTVSNALVEAFDELGLLKVSKATGGSTTTIIDTVTAPYIGSDDTWNRGWYAVIHDAGGLSAAPENEIGNITDWAQGTGTFTIDTVTAAVAANDIYGIVAATYPLQQCIRRLNAALIELGTVPLHDTSITTASAQREYTLPAALKNAEPFRVQIQGTLSDANANLWVDLQPGSDWYVTKSAAGSTALLILINQPPVGYQLKLWYHGRHGYVSAYNDVINEVFDPKLVTAAFVQKINAWRLAKDGYEDEALIRGWNVSKAEKEQAKLENPPYKLHGRSKILSLNNPHGEDEDDFTYPAPP